MNYFDLSDAELMSRLMRDDRIAFETIHRRHAPDLFKYLSGKVDTKDDCEEILIDVSSLFGWTGIQSAVS